MIALMFLHDRFHFHLRGELNAAICGKTQEDGNLKVERAMRELVLMITETGLTQFRCRLRLY